jgi:nitrite reductase/ring-hydroxylating ferredoxin subunit
MHVALGLMQHERSPLVPFLLVVCFGTVAALHILAAAREKPGDAGGALTSDGWIAVGDWADIPDKRAVIVCAPGGERIAVFRDGRTLSAVTNLCAHQNGPLGEGEVIDGCITCPWHGYQYRLEDGCAPPPFTEKLLTYRLRLRGGIVDVHPAPQGPGVGGSITVSGPLAPKA